MRNVKKVIKLTEEEELCSLLYGCICAASYVEKKQGSLVKYNPINFIIESLYNLNFEVYPHLNHIPYQGGARYIMNNVSSYRCSRGYNIRRLRKIDKLFERYGCKTKEDIIKLINNIYITRNDLTNKDEIIKKVLIAYETYYKNNAIIQTFPKDEILYREYLLNKIKKHDDSYTQKVIESTSYRSIRSLEINHITYPEVKMLILADGNRDENLSSCTFEFLDYMNEWFISSNPYDKDYKDKLEKVILKINSQFQSEHKLNTSASLAVITKEKTYIASMGDTRVYLINETAQRIKRDENLYDKLKEKKVPLMDYYRTIPIGTIGYNADSLYKCNPEITEIPTSQIEGLFMDTYYVHEIIDDEELSITLSLNRQEDVLDTLSIIHDLYKYPSGILFWKKEKQKNNKHIKRIWFIHFYVVEYIHILRGEKTWI